MSLNIKKMKEKIKNNNIYVNHDDSFYNNLNNMSNNELTNLSWSNISDDELIKNSNTISLSKSSYCTSEINSSQEINDNKNERNEKLIDLNKIIKIIFNQTKDLKILEYQTFVSGYLRKNIKVFQEHKFKKNMFNENYKSDITNIEDICNIDIYLKYLNWLLLGTTYFEKKLKLKPINGFHNLKKNTLISRSSYKFCNYNYDCEFNYNTKKNHGCYAQHYVYNIVRVDIKSLIDYLEKNKNNENINLKEVKKCIDTISFVINHMYEELKNVDYYNNGNSDHLHIEKTPLKKKKKKNKFFKKNN